MKKEILLAELRKYEWMERTDKNVFKAKAYAKVIKGIEQLSEVKSIDDLLSVEGIGDSIRTKCEHILQSIMEIDKRDESIQLFQHIYGIGPVKATELVKHYKLYTFDDLRSHQDLLTPIQRIGLQYVEDSMLRIPRKEMDKHCHLLLKLLQTSTSGKLMGCIVGSYRRKKESSGDIDMCITYQQDVTNAPVHFERFIQECISTGYICDILAKGSKKCLSFCRLTPNSHVRRLDLLLTPPHEFATSLLYFTGSQQFNIKMRSKALELGYTLNEHALTPLRNNTPKPPFFKCEEDVFQFLQLEYTPPEKR